MEALEQKTLRILIVEDDEVHRIVHRRFVSKSDLPICETLCTHATSNVGVAGNLQSKESSCYP